MAEKNEKKTEKLSLADFVKVHVAEFKRIIWPSRETLLKETVTVIVVSLILGVIIYLLDTGFQIGYDSLYNVFSNIR